MDTAVYVHKHKKYHYELSRAVVLLHIQPTLNLHKGCVLRIARKAEIAYDQNNPGTVPMQATFSEPRRLPTQKKSF